MRSLYAWGAAALAILALDAIWLGFIAKPWYRAGIGHLMADNPNFVAAAAFYAVYALGIVVFTVSPFAAGEWRRSLLAAALFGCVAYGTYDLSNLATLKGWPLGLSLLDIAWGCVVSMAAAAAGRAVLDYGAAAS